ncbi:MAG: resuscitation-promoting factor RpfB [Actinomycetota bacterium]|nr:resuscitation-promoting factor RpfB [Actinomycetota bacterium]
MSRTLPLVLAAVMTTGVAGAALLPASSTRPDARQAGVLALSETPVTPVPTDWTTAGRTMAASLVAQQAAQARAAKAAADARARQARSARASRSRLRTVSYGSPRAIARAMLAERGWSGQFGCLDSLWSRESGWRVHASNPSGAYGIPQALPGSKMASAGSDWRTNPATQIRWGLGYIAAAYGSPCSAWRHSQSTGWY